MHSDNLKEFKSLTNITNFRIYGQGNKREGELIQKQLSLRSWDELKEREKNIAYQEIKNRGWLDEHSNETIEMIEYLNNKYLRLLPGRELHKIPYKKDYRGNDNIYDRYNAANYDARDIILNQKEAVVFSAITALADQYINYGILEDAKVETNNNERGELISKAYKNFDKFANCINNIFDQFSINVKLTRSSLIPVQESQITVKVYEPVISILSDPKWEEVNNNLARTFDDFDNKDYPEAITKAHQTLQLFLQTFTGEQAKNGKGELSKLFKKLKEEKLIQYDYFSEPIIRAFESYFPAERAKKSTAKPATKTATKEDALLIINVLMIFLQHCLQNY